jgi:hypothetical protein
MTLMRFLFTIAAAVVLIAPSASAQENILRQKAIRQQKLKQQKAQQQKMLPLPAPAVERFLQMSPEDREKALSQLTPERREQMEQRLQRLEQLPADQRQGLQDVYPAFMELRPARQQAVRQEIRLLRQLRPVERRNRLNNDAGDYSPEEMDILRRVAGIPE